ncbi:MAG: hypothetical protein Kow00105_13980 [Phycisphaeraceae bacterium]
MGKSIRIINAWVVAVGLSAVNCQAALVTSSSSLTPSTVIDFQQFTTLAIADAIPVQVGTPVGWDVEVFGIGNDTYIGPVSHSLGSNGSWNSTSDPSFYSARLPVGTSLAMDFVFNTMPVMGVGGFMNYAPGYGPVLIEAYDASGTLLESHEISTVAPISTPGGLNQGAFRGILRTSADITTFRLAGGYAVIDNLAFIGVPEPASIFCLGMGGACLFKRKRKG